MDLELQQLRELRAKCLKSEGDSLVLVDTADVLEMGGFPTWAEHLRVIVRLAAEVRK